MATKLTHDIKREVTVGEDLYTVTIAPAGLKIVPKGKRKGYELTWSDLATGTAELDIRLRQSLAPTRAARSRKTPAAQALRPSQRGARRTRSGQ